MEREPQATHPQTPVQSPSWWARYRNRPTAPGQSKAFAGVSCLRRESTRSGACAAVPRCRTHQDPRALTARRQAAATPDGRWPLIGSERDRGTPLHLDLWHNPWGAIPVRT